MIRHWGRWIVFGDTRSQRMISTLLHEEPFYARSIRGDVAYGHVRFRRPERDTILFNTGHSGLDRPDYAQRVARLGLRPIYFIHDLIPISHPEYCRTGEVNRHERRVRTMLETGNGIIANSEDTLRALNRFAALHRLPVPPTVVAPIGTTVLPPPASKLSNSGRPYFLILGTIEPRKNHLLLLHVWRTMVEAALRAGHTVAEIPRLVVIGQRGWDCEQVLDLLERCPALYGNVIELPHCNDAMLASWLRHARALLFPSFVEGYGMPLAEALAHGVPVIASDLPVFREVAGDVPDYLNPLDGPAWIRAITDYAAPESPARAAQLARLRQFRAPSWDEHFNIIRGFTGQLWREARHAP